MNDVNANVSVTITDPLRSKVENAVKSFVTQNQVFTAFDVTVSLRGEFPGMRITHDDVKRMVADMFDQSMGTYQKTNIKLNVGAYAICYHPVGVDANTHPLSNNPVTAPVQVVPTAPAVVTPNTAQNDSLTVENRLNVPISLLSELSLSPGKRVKLSASNGVLALTPTVDTTGETLVVNADGRLRLNPTTLKKAFGTIKSKFDICISSDKTAILVREN